MTDEIMKGKTALITGSTSGHGEALAHIIAGMGADVILMGRNENKCKSVQKAIFEKTGKNPDILLCNLSSKEDINRAAKEFLSWKKPLHLLVNNAGIVNKKKKMSVDGIEEVFAVNYLAQFQLTLLLLEKLKENKPSRIVLVASDAHKIGKIDLDDIDYNKTRYSWMKSYGRSKLALIYFTKMLAEKIKNTGVTINAVDPGPVRSNIVGNEKGITAALARGMINLCFPKPEKAARTAIYIATSTEVEGITGKYYRFMKEKSPKVKHDEDFFKKLWELSAKLTGVDIN